MPLSSSQREGASIAQLYVAEESSNIEAPLDLNHVEPQPGTSRQQQAQPSTFREVEPQPGTSRDPQPGTSREAEPQPGTSRDPQPGTSRQEDEFVPINLRENNSISEREFSAKLVGKKCGTCQDSWLCRQCDGYGLNLESKPPTILKRFCEQCKQFWLCGACAPRIEDPRLCCICLSEEKNLILLPCRHACIGVAC